MPIYEYRCASCGKDFELTRSFSQSGDPAPCPTCGKAAQKLVSGFASKADYTVKIPAKEPFRAPFASTAVSAPKSSTAAKASSKKAAPSSAKASKSKARS